MLRGIPGHLERYGLLLATAAFLTLFQLGKPSLWDIDEGNNAEAAREMMESGDWIVPTFNFQLRPDKPALLYWLQIGAYHVAGVGEFAARLPSALATILAVLVTCALGQLVFDAETGFIAGLVLASSIMPCAAARFANPDALLCALSLMTFTFFWLAFSNEQPRWLVLASISAGLATLAKGPVGLVLPLAATILFLLSVRRLALFRPRNLVWPGLAFAVVVLPWYVWVAVQTRLEFVQGFFMTHNLGRFRATMEGHDGPFFYYALCAVAGFAPWSVFLGPVLRDVGRSVREAWNERKRRTPDPSRAGLSNRLAGAFFICWIGTYFLFFSVSATKLPNYILPIYPPLALLTARVLQQWLRGAGTISPWQWRLALGALATVGVAFSIALLALAGQLKLPFAMSRQFPELARYAGLGAILGFVAAFGIWCLKRDARTVLMLSLTGGSVAFVGSVAAWGAAALDAHKAPRFLAGALERQQMEPEIRIGAYQYFQPSLVFYCQREVARLKDDEEVSEFLSSPLEVYLFIPADIWKELGRAKPVRGRVLSRHEDFYANREILVVTNRG